MRERAAPEKKISSGIQRFNLQRDIDITENTNFLLYLIKDYVTKRNGVIGHDTRDM